MGLGLNLKRRLLLATGGLIFALVGGDRFYLMMQRDGRFARALRAFASAPEIARLVSDWRSAEIDAAVSRRSPTSETMYGGGDIGGYGSKQISGGDQHLPLLEQVRCLLLPDVESRTRGSDTVVEIGCGNGDVVALLAGRRPDARFIGVDFALASARDVHRAANLGFVEGYALDLLESGALHGDVLFASQTFCVAGPQEMKAYAEAIVRAGFSTVLILDPAIRGYTPTRFPGRSIHLRRGAWGHDYRAIFGRAGFRTERVEIVEYRKNRRKPLLHYQLFVAAADKPGAASPAPPDAA